MYTRVIVFLAGVFVHAFFMFTPKFIAESMKTHWSQYRWCGFSLPKLEKGGVAHSKQFDGGNSNIFHVHPELWGRWTHFDVHIFSDGLKLNHQPGETWQLGYIKSKGPFWSSMGIWWCMLFLYGCWTKNSGCFPQNGWWKSWKTPIV